MIVKRSSLPDEVKPEDNRGKRGQANVGEVGGSGAGSAAALMNMTLTHKPVDAHCHPLARRLTVTPPMHLAMGVR